MLLRTPDPATAPTSTRPPTSTGQPPPTAGATNTFNNPIVAQGPDPWLQYTAPRT